VPRGERKLSAEADFWAGLFLDLTVRVEWLEQALDAVPREDATAEALVRLRSYSRALAELHTAIDAVQAHRSDPELKPLFHLDGALAGYLSRLYGWCEEIGADFERMAGALRRREPTNIVFSHKAVNRSYSQFDGLVSAMRRTTDSQREPRAPKAPPKNRVFDERLEELIWATEWVHMTLARPPGE
jgi:hypothetical protein